MIRRKIRLRFSHIMFMIMQQGKGQQMMSAALYLVAYLSATLMYAAVTLVSEVLRRDG